jgi:DNA replication protein DnaC
MKMDIRVVYMPYRNVITDLKQNLMDDYKGYKKMISRYQECQVLMIDDLFKGRINDSDINIVFEILNHRYINRLSIIVST